MLKKGFSHKDAKKIRPLCIFLSKMSAYVRDFDETKDLSFLIKDDELWENIRKFVKKLKIVSKMNLIVNLYSKKISKS